jgi:hypothetical protein
VKATVGSATAAQLTVRVPAGASLNPISVTANRFTAWSKEPFRVTFPGAVDSGFVERAFYPVATIPGGNTVTIATADLDGDGKSDLIRSYFGGLCCLSFTVSRNTSAAGSVSFGPESVYPLSGYEGQNFGIADFNGDGKLDVAIQHRSAGRIGIYKNKSTPGNILLGDYIWDNFVINAVGQAVNDIAVADVDHDGKTDIIAALGKGIGVMRNISTGDSIVFAPPVQFHISLGQIQGMDIGDFDMDGKPDVVVSNLNTFPYGIFVIKNTSVSGVISFAVPLPVGAMYASNYSVKAADFDNDGFPDIALLKNGSGDSLNIFRNTTSAGIISFSQALELKNQQWPPTLQVADLDGDGRIDIGTVEWYSRSAMLYKNRSTTPTITMKPRQDLTLDSMGTWIHFADLDNDGKTDAIVSSINRSVVWRNRLDSNGTLEPLIAILCPGETTTFTSNLTGASYQWQVDTGIGFTNLVNGTNYSGVNTASLQVINSPSSFTHYRYRAIVDAKNSDVHFLSFQNKWTGAFNNSWANAANWSCGVVPDVNTDVLVTSGNVIIDANVTIRTLTVNAGATITVNPGFTLTVTH